MNKKQTGYPFQEGYASDGGDVERVFTDYRWNDGSDTRLVAKPIRVIHGLVGCIAKGIREATYVRPIEFITAWGYIEGYRYIFVKIT